MNGRMTGHLSASQMAEGLSFGNHRKVACLDFTFSD